MGSVLGMVFVGLLFLLMVAVIMSTPFLLYYMAFKRPKIELEKARTAYQAELKKYVTGGNSDTLRLLNEKGHYYYT